MLTTAGERIVREASDLEMARRLWNGFQRARGPKKKLSMRRAYESFLDAGGYRGVRWEPNPETGKYEITALVPR